MRFTLFFIFIFILFSACTGSQSGVGTPQSDEVNPGASEIAGPRGNGNGYGGIIRIDRIILSTLTGRPGIQVTIHGSEFAGLTTVMIDAQVCSNLIVVDSSTITCQLPAFVDSVAFVEVTSNNNVAQKIFSVPLPPPPTISSLSTSSGTLRVHGTGFEPGTQIYVSDFLCPNTIFVSSQELRCTIPGEVFSVSVNVTNPNGQYAILANSFSYSPPLTLFSLSPISGPASGGTLITLLGEGFDESIQITVGVSLCTNVVRVSASELNCQTPPGTGSGTVEVRKTNGQVANLPSGVFSYIMPLYVSGLAPIQGPTSGGTLVTVSGTGFHAGILVYLDQVPQLNVSVQSDNILTFQTVGGTSGPLPLRVVNPNSEMQVFSGAFSYRNPPDQWISVTTVGEPSARSGHSAIWTGSKMIVWGGYNSLGVAPSGGMYDPVVDSWTATTLVPPTSAVYNHVAAWTGQRMIVWSGVASHGFPMTGGYSFDPIGNTWTRLNTSSQPHGRDRAKAVWTGSKMIVWGGSSMFAGLSNQTGGVYDPSNDSWNLTSNVNVPEGYLDHSAIWAGSRMIVWGGSGDLGSVNSGRKYDPITNIWETISIVNAPPARGGHIAIWTGSQMIVWGSWGGPLTPYLDGAFYEPIADSWSPMNGVNAPAARSSAAFVWTGQKLIIWGGGSQGFPLGTGAIFDVASQTWSTINNIGAPSARSSATGVWTGSEMIVWGGWGNGTWVSQGARYSP